jgi:glycerol-3-phosphate acyltransferase PlsX
MIKSEINSSFKSKLGGLMLKSSFKRIKSKVDYNNLGGAVFLGAKKLVIKSHGSSTAETIMNTIFQALSLVNAGTIQALEKAFARGFGVTVEE